MCNLYIICFKCPEVVTQHVAIRMVKTRWYDKEEFIHLSCWSHTKANFLLFYFNIWFHTFMLYKVMYTQFTTKVYKENSQSEGGGGEKERQHSVKVNTQQIFQQKTLHQEYIDLRGFELKSTSYCYRFIKPYVEVRIFTYEWFGWLTKFKKKCQLLPTAPSYGTSVYRQVLPWVRLVISTKCTYTHQTKGEFWIPFK